MITTPATPAAPADANATANPGNLGDSEDPTNAAASSNRRRRYFAVATIFITIPVMGHQYLASQDRHADAAMRDDALRVAAIQDSYAAIPGHSPQPFTVKPGATIFLGAMPYTPSRHNTVTVTTAADAYCVHVTATRMTRNPTHLYYNSTTDTFSTNPC